MAYVVAGWGSAYCRHVRLHWEGFKDALERIASVGLLDKKFNEVHSAPALDGKGLATGGDLHGDLEQAHGGYVLQSGAYYHQEGVQLVGGKEKFWVLYL